MSFLPIVQRELRVGARRKATYRFRLFSALGAILFVGALTLWAEVTSSRASIGTGMFYTLAGATFLYCLFAGLRNTADCLSEEKRAGTLGLLFLTDLKGYDVVFGKFAATSLSTFYGLLAVFPPLGIPLVLGGVTVGEFWRLTLVLLVTLFFSLTTGLLVSSFTRDARHAWGGTALVTAVFSIVPWAANFLPIPGILKLPVSPVCAFFGMVDGSYSVSPGYFWGAVSSLIVLGMGFLVAASVILPRAWHEGAESAADALVSRWSKRIVRQPSPQELAEGAADAWVPRWSKRIVREPSPQELAARKALVDVNPVVWLAARGEGQRVLVWVAVLAGSLLGVGLSVVVMVSKSSPISILVVFMLLHLTLSLWLATEACSVFATARDSGALELLLCTPLSMREILHGHLLGLTRAFQRPLIVLLAVEAVLLVAFLVVKWNAGTALQILFFNVIGAGMFSAIAVMDLFAVARYGMWTGLISKKPGRALAKTVLVVLGPMVITPCCAVIWPVVGLLKNVVIMSYAQEQLRRHFRAVITERYGTADDGNVIVQPSRRQIESHLPPVLPR